MLVLVLIAFLAALTQNPGVISAENGANQGSLITTIRINVWSGNPPDAIENPEREREDSRSVGTVSHVSVPTLAIYLPTAEKNTGTALIYCSGGSYSTVSALADDVGNAEYFVSRGIALIVLKYRTSPPCRDFSAAQEDGREAVRVVRRHAAAWKIHPDRIGMLGASAGAHLILSVATKNGTMNEGRNPTAADRDDQFRCRPDFIVLLCLWPGNEDPPAFPVNSETPPIFLCSARDDLIAPAAFSENILSAWQKAGVPAEHWVIESGGHTAFSNLNFAAGHDWGRRMLNWMNSIGVLSMNNNDTDAVR